MFNFSLQPTYLAALDEAALPYPERWEGSREGHHTPQAALLSGGRWDKLLDWKRLPETLTWCCWEYLRID